VSSRQDWDYYFDEIGLLIVANRFVPEGKEDQVVQMLRALADECKAEMSEGR
jgi:hypothetical protein